MRVHRFARAVIVATALAVAVGATGRAQTPASLTEDTRVQQALELMKVWLEAQRAYDEVPGISAAVVHDQAVLWSGGYGYRDVEARSPATADTIYSICSISKLFTSVAVMQLRDRGKLRLDDVVSAHLPWFRIKNTAPQAGDATIEGLLTHASGLPRESDHPYWTGPEFRFPTREEIISRIEHQETLYPAETYHQYSNLGLTLAGEIVAAAAGTPYDQYIRENILGPLKLTNTTTEMPETERAKRLAKGYSAINRSGSRQPVPFFVTRGIAPAAGYASTAEDLGRFAAWQFRLLEKGGTEVLAANTLREMHRVHWVDPDFETTWGLGFAVTRANGETFVGHGGSCPGYRTHLLLKPDRRVATVFMANALGVNSSQWTQKMYEIVAPAIKAAVKEPGKGKPTDPELTPYLGTYTSAFGGEYAIVRWEDGLGLLALPTMEPVKNLTKLKKVGEHRFRRVRKDETLGDEIVFEMGADGKPTRFRMHSNYYPRAVAPAPTTLAKR
jgi:CubicO group peptidase (beta-lactamase class C family)